MGNVIVASIAVLVLLATPNEGYKNPCVDVKKVSMQMSNLGLSKLCFEQNNEGDVVFIFHFSIGLTILKTRKGYYGKNHKTSWNKPKYGSSRHSGHHACIIHRICYMSP